MTSLTMAVHVIRTNGTEEKHQVPRGSIQAIQKLIGCDVFDAVNLRDGRVMLVDDEGLLTARPVNEKASEIYRSVTRPGDHFIAGDVAIVRDEDFA